MNQPPLHDYYYGSEAEQYIFYRLPKALFSNSRYKGLSDGAKILYGLMLDRMGLSMKNGWLDDLGRVFIYFTLEDVQEYMNCRQDKGVKLLAELDTVKGVGLIERVKQGQGRPTKIYVKKFYDAPEVLTSEKPKSALPDGQTVVRGFGKLWEQPLLKVIDARRDAPAHEVDKKPSVRAQLKAGQPKQDVTRKRQPGRIGSYEVWQIRSLCGRWKPLAAGRTKTGCRRMTV